MHPPKQTWWRFDIRCTYSATCRQSGTLIRTRWAKPPETVSAPDEDIRWSTHIDVTRSLWQESTASDSSMSLRDWAFFLWSDCILLRLHHRPLPAPKGLALVRESPSWARVAAARYAALFLRPCIHILTHPWHKARFPPDERRDLCRSSAHALAELGIFPLMVRHPVNYYLGMQALPGPTTEPPGLPSPLVIRPGADPTHLSEQCLGLSELRPCSAPFPVLRSQEEELR